MLCFSVYSDLDVCTRVRVRVRGSDVKSILQEGNSICIFGNLTPLFYKVAGKHCYLAFSFKPTQSVKETFSNKSIYENYPCERKINCYIANPFGK